MIIPSLNDSWDYVYASELPPPIFYPHKQEIRDKILLLSLLFINQLKLTLWKKLTFASFDNAKLWRIFTES